ncbi:DeoR/GlpR family DNA-binding transcription regulator [Siphonobacter sp. SORGH_AS_0500]|uniref:DeoR/GlpR family DNA-binding transcription regulator n=1 Tax=Siphonobacter sp. SORGH_AS_0500 TaxID=1864824 RepID=UPI001E2A6762|nr:DeoR/GlpR family DNA-binding transcription regulator [Siphonobacter sp. SORGH_AS_0500]
MSSITNAMLKAERHSFILHQLNIYNRILSSDLSQKLNVSEDTIRRDLNELADSGQLIKVHGGALSRSYGHIATRSEVYATNQKDIIAQKTLSLIREGMFLLLGGGTTVRSLVRMIPSHLRLTIFTISPVIALELIENPNLEVYLLGGRVTAENQICSGGEVIHRLSEIRVDLLILGTTGIDAVQGLTESDMEVVQVKKAMMKSADQVAILTISEKLGTSHRMKLCDLGSIQTLITELEPQDASLQMYAKAGLTLL